ncbi:MAG: ABC transporter permease [Planctomycetota bacterium]|nr:ABC transporter permease [Planctomycetota bacterium]
MPQLARPIRRSLASAAMELARHPWRTLLICQGILWAVALMVAPASILQGSRQAAVDQARELKTDLVQVEVEQGASSALTVEDVTLLARNLEQQFPGTRVSGQKARSVQIEVAGERVRGWIVISDVTEIDARSLKLNSGRWYRTGVDPPEVVVEEPLARRLGISIDAAGEGHPQEIWLAPGPAQPPSTQGTDPWPAGIGGEIPHGARLWKVVGVIESPGESAINPLGFGEDHQFAGLVEGVLRMIGVSPDPAPWLQSGMSMHLDRENLDEEFVDWIVVSTDPNRVAEVSREVENTLISRGRTPLIYANAAWAILASPELDGYLVLHDVFFAITAVIGLLVLTNLMLLTGRRRRAEVGLRRAEGATRADIFWQFLVEGICISLVGAILGSMVGVALATLRATLDPAAVLAATWPWSTIVEAMAIVIVGAAVASAGPAWSVSGTDPALLLREGRG